MEGNEEHEYTSNKELVGQPEPAPTVPVVPLKSNMHKKRNETKGTRGTSWSGQEVKWRGTLARDDGGVIVGICAMDKKV